MGGCNGVAGGGMEVALPATCGGHLAVFSLPPSTHIDLHRRSSLLRPLISAGRAEVWFGREGRKIWIMEERDPRG
jgi:hypothetical protein